MTPDAPVTPSAQPERPVGRPHIAEWFGHRVFPVVATGDIAASDQHSHRCPFLTQTLQASTGCVKAVNSRGVCTISATSNGSRQDWLVCPYRALDDGLLADMVKRLYSIPALDLVLIRRSSFSAIKQSGPRYAVLSVTASASSSISRTNSAARSDYPGRQPPRNCHSTSLPWNSLPTERSRNCRALTSRDSAWASTA